MPTDKLLYDYARHFPNPLSQFLQAEPDDYEATSITFKEIEKRADIFLIGRSGAHVILVETQGYDNEWLYYDMVTKLMLFCTHRKYHGRIDAAAVFLDESHWRVAQVFKRQFGKDSVLQFSPRVYVFGRMKLEEMKEQGNVFLTPLYPLCDITPAEIEQHAREWAEEIKTSSGLEEKDRKNLLALLGGAISHRIKNITTDRISSLFGGFTMEDTEVVQEILQKNAPQWIGRGIHQVLTKLITARFGTIPDDIRLRIQSISDTEELERIATAMLTIQTLDELRDLVY